MFICNAFSFRSYDWESLFYGGRDHPPNPVSSGYPIRIMCRIQDCLVGIKFFCKHKMLVPTLCIVSRAKKVVLWGWFRMSHENAMGAEDYRYRLNLVLHDPRMTPSSLQSYVEHPFGSSNCLSNCFYHLGSDPQEVEDLNGFSLFLWWISTLFQVTLQESKCNLENWGTML